MKNFSIRIGVVWSFVITLFILVAGALIENWQKDKNKRSEIQYSTAKSVLVTDLVSIEELQKAINENQEMFKEDGVIVGPNYVVLVDKEKLSIQVVQSPVKSITSSEKINPTPTPKQVDDNAGSIGAEP